VLMSVCVCVLCTVRKHHIVNEMPIEVKKAMEKDQMGGGGRGGRGGGGGMAPPRG